MNLSNLRPARGSRKVNRRAGRGESSGLGTTAGKGHKGQRARAGKDIRKGFEGGQMPLLRRLPKFGFTNIFRREVAVVNLADLNRFDTNATVDLKALKEKALIRAKYEGAYKILGKGELKKSLTVKATAFSKSAAAAIEKAGGKAEVIKA